VRESGRLDGLGTLESMAQELPIACTLSGPDLRERLAEIREVGRGALLEAAGESGRRVLRFRRSDGVAERLARIVEAESQCCAFLDLRLDASDGLISLTIEGPEGAEPVVDELAGAFSG
jgi:MerR family transcriptional regulator, copper efflux regulator